MNKILSKYHALSLPLKAALWFTICNIALKGISFFTAPLFARLLPVEEYGKVLIFASYEQLIIIFATWEVAVGTYQKGIFKYKSQAEQFTTSTLLFSNALTIILFSLIFVFNKQFTEFTEMSSTIIITMFASAFVMPAYRCWITRKRVEYDYKRVTLFTFFLAVLQIVVPMACILLLDRTAEIKFLFTLLPAVLLYVVFYVKELKIHSLVGRINAVKKQWHFILLFTAPVVLHSLSYLVLAQADRVMIGKLVGNTEAGIYSVAYTIASIAIIVQNSVNQAITPWIYHSMEAKEYSNIKKKTLYVILAVSMVYILYILVAPEIIIILYPEIYHEGIWCIPPIAMGVYFMFLYTLFVNFQTYLEQTKYIALVSSVCAVLNIVLNYFGILWFGYIACAYTTLICYILFAIGHYYFMSKLTKKMLPGVLIYNGKMILFIGIVMLGFMIFATLLYDLPAVRYGILGLSVIVAILFRKKIIALVRKVKLA